MHRSVGLWYRIRAAVLLLLVSASGLAAAPVWLQRLESLPSVLRAQLQQRWQTWSGWSTAQRDDYARRAAAWDALAPAERALHRERYLAWQALPESDRARVRDAAARLAALPPDLQQAWRARFAAFDGSQQRGWLLGPTLGADYAALQPLLAQVPEAQRAPLLQTLRAMTAQQRAELGVLAQRTPPQQRDALRRELIATPAAARGDWLWQRLQH